MDEATTIEEQRWLELQESRQTKEEEKELKRALGKRKKKKLSFSQKISKHWLILAAAAMFDVFGLIPFLGIAVNFVFGLILWLYFVIQKSKGGNDLVDIGMPILGGSVVDFFVGIVPVNTATTLIKIARTK